MEHTNPVKNFFTLIFLIFLSSYLSGCATVSVGKTEPVDAQQFLSSQDQKSFNHYMNVSQDGSVVNWRNEDENTSFELTATHTRVNERGLACRDYQFIIDKDYHRKKVFNNTACRDNGNWQN